MELPLRSERMHRAAAPTGSVRLREDAPVILHIDPPSFPAEQYRLLAVQIEERLNPIGTWGYALSVTSPDEGAGKTLTSLNVALTLTRGEERRVLLVEGDLWRPRLHTYFDPERADRPGLQQVLERRLDLAEAVVTVEGTSLDLLTAGASGFSGDVMSGRRISEILTEARAAYEIVVIDSPPMGMLASARSIATRSDGVVVVVRAGQSKRKGIEKTLEAIGPEKVIGMVLNGVKSAGRGYRGYY